MKLNINDKVDGKEIDLSLNELVDVPAKELAALPKVTHIDLSCNHIQSLPASFGSLTHIVWLDLSKNKLSDLPQNFGSLQQLQHLDLYANKLTTLPVSFCQLKKLGWLDLKDNPLNQNLKSVAGDCLDEKQCLQCAKKIVEYFRTVNSDLEREKQKRLQKEREREMAKKLEEELELKKQKEQKKLEKLQRKAQLQEQRLKESQQETVALETNTKSQEFEAKNGFVPLKERRNPFGSCLKWLIIFAILLPLTAVCIEIAYHVYAGHRIDSVAQARQLVVADLHILRQRAIEAWGFVLNVQEQLIRFLTSKWKQWNADSAVKRNDL